MTIAPDYGIDLSCATDLDPMMRPVSGLEVIKQAITRRLQSRVGSLFTDPRYGLDVRELLSVSTVRTGTATASYIAGQIRSQILADERIDSVVINSAAYSEQTRALDARFTVYSASGPFGLVIALTPATLDVIAVGA